MDHRGRNRALWHRGFGESFSRGHGLLRNVECGLFTGRPSDLAALNRWFDLQWAAAPPLSRTYEEYIRNFQTISGLRPIAAALDAFFYDYRDKQFADGS